ncbi:MAG: hypothetical protein D6741_16670 [Planctomycetota bacterium]|nr:MAG: hypothetical protein D6741_16670 [Planctomycetota bacterium]
MAITAIVVGNVLFLVGIASFLMTGASHPTALIPVVAGSLIEACGILALAMPQLRHAATIGLLVVGLLSAMAASARPIMKLIAGESLTMNMALASQIVMAVGGLIVLAVAVFVLVGGNPAASAPGNEIPAASDEISQGE